MVPIRFLVLALVSLFALGSNYSVAQDDGFAPDTSVVATYSEASQAELAKFRKALIAAGESAQKSGEITRAELFRLRIASANPIALRKMHQCCAEQVMSEGKAKSFTAIDWDKLLSFIKEVIPIILELIKLFSYTVPDLYHQTDMQLVYYESDTLFSLAA